MKLKSFIIRKCLSLLLFILGISVYPQAHTAENVWDVLRSEFVLNLELTRPEVQEQLRWLIAHPSYLQKVSHQCEPYIYHILSQIKKRNLPGELALIPMLESAFDPFAYSGVGAAGLWQLMPKTGKDLGLKQDWWYDARRSIGPSTDAALNYLVRLSKFFNGDWLFAIAAYDSGEGTIARAIKSINNPASAQFWNIPIPRETSVYVPRLLALAEIIKNPERYRITLPEIPYIPYFEEVDIGSQIDLNHAAKLAGISYKELIKLNPGFNRWTTAPYKPFRLLIPSEKVERFNLNLANFPENKRVSWTKHQVRQGDSLSNIANRYHTTVNLIKQLNQLTSNAVSPNQSILIPSSKNAEVDTNRTPSPTNIHKSEPLLTARNHRIIHIVQPHETLEKIQKIYQVQASEIARWNQLKGRAIHQGQQLVIWKKVKQPTAYIVQKGDSLSMIAKLNQTQVNTILNLNPELKRNKPLRLGQKIWIG